MSDAEADKTVFKPGEVISGRYAILRLIAEGGQAEVYQVWDEKEFQYLALKTMLLQHTDKPRLIDRARAEAETLLKVRHPNVVRVDAAGVDRGHLWFVMELLEGRTLRDVIGAAGAVPLAVAVSLGIQMAEAIAYAHEFVTVYRDLKPENVFVCISPGKPDHALKLLDFGAAKFADVVTVAGTTIGTISYMAPEQARENATHPSVDIYALGTVLFETLTGSHPLAVQSRPKELMEWIGRIVDLEPPLLRTVLPSAPERLERLLAMLLQKDPKRRITTASAVAEELRAVAQDLERAGLYRNRRLEGAQAPWDTASMRAAARVASPADLLEPVARVRAPGVAEPSREVEIGVTTMSPLTPPHGTGDWSTTTESKTIAQENTSSETAQTVMAVDLSQTGPHSPNPRESPQVTGPRVEAKPDAKTTRGTVRMLGKRGTVPLIEPGPEASAFFAALAPEARPTMMATPNTPAAPPPAVRVSSGSSSSGPASTGSPRSGGAAPTWIDKPNIVDAGDRRPTEGNLVLPPPQQETPGGLSAQARMAKRALPNPDEALAVTTGNSRLFLTVAIALALAAIPVAGAYYYFNRAEPEQGAATSSAAPAASSAPERAAPTGAAPASAAPVLSSASPAGSASASASARPTATAPLKHP